MNMAESCREITDNAWNEMLRLEYGWAMANIKLTANSGKKWCDAPRIHHETLKRLKEEGFAVSDSQIEGCVISWN